ncbi:hypothetical protein ACFY91_18790 [Streptomyces albogriseolus]|uniref:hypothetical protein n=1 Tax=Streptomyces albogriseolus TaxID=1887 RepID=UPI0036ED9150
MSDHSTVATDLTSQYVAQVANDLERNAKEQERVGAEIDGLRQQLAALQRDHALLVKMQQALNLAADTSEGTADASGDTAVAEPAAATEPSEKDGAAEPAEETAVSGHATVPAPRSRGGVKSGAAKPKRERKKVTAGGAGKAAGAARTGGAARTTGAAKLAGPARSAGDRSTRKPATPKPAGKAAAVKTARKAPAKAAESAQDAPKLVDLVRRHLDEQKEPRSAAEVATALGQAHPGRTIKVTVIRSTLEGLVARNQAQRSKQGTSVFYTAPDGSTPAPERAADAQS